MPEYTLKASVDVAVTADTPQQAKRAAFELLTSCRQEKRRGRPTGSPVASVTGVTIGCDGKHELRPVVISGKTAEDYMKTMGAAETPKDPVWADAMEGSES